METVVYLYRQCDQALRDMAVPEGDTARAVGWCACCGTWGWGERERPNAK